MAKYINEKKLQQELFKRTEGYAAEVRKIYLDSLGKIIELVKGTELEDGKPFSFSDYGYSEDVTPILRNMYSQTYQTIRNSVQKEWLLSNENNDALVKSVFGERSIEDNHFARFFLRNMEAMDAFFARKTKDGLNLSQKVWKYTGMYKEELEKTLDLAIGEGIPANRLATKIKEYLNDPDRWYRRFRVKIGEDENGNPIYGRKWKRRVYDQTTETYKWVDDDPKKYHPGKGVYRSSYRNAQRLARTETNIAYRTADFTRWGQLDFVVGIEIKLSNNHPVHDICDDLKGIYPKTFKWTGWHPNCRCYQVPVLAKDEEIEKMLDKLLEDENATLENSENEVKEVPRQFTEWVKNNDERIRAAKAKGTLPYFLRDNKEVPVVKYNSYGSQWRRMWYYNTGGFLVAHSTRYENSQKNKNEKAKYDKEVAMCRVLAQKGYQIEMLEEVPGISSPDITIDGTKADLKRLSSANNIERHAKEAVREQGADIVIFQFDNETEAIHTKLYKLKKMGYKVLYFFTGRENEVFEL